ncbi:MAG: HAMP domain-containing histidine kinase [Alphaproteobacteria bacterium]|nr:HAMP domain-containing histidine kinase [Alphaproteobacteria bacterium]
MPTEQLTGTRRFRTQVYDVIPGTLPQRALVALSPLLVGTGVWGLLSTNYAATLTMLFLGSLFALSPRLVATQGTAIAGQVLCAAIVAASVLPVAVAGAPAGLLLLLGSVPFVAYAWLGTKDALQWAAGPGAVVALLGVRAGALGDLEAAAWCGVAGLSIASGTGFAYAFRDAMSTASKGADPRQPSLEREYHAVLEALEMALGTSAKKDRFLALMSFELRTPLTAIMGYSELLGEVLEDIGTEHDVRETRAIEDSSRRLLHVVDDILDLSQITEGTLELRSAPVDLQAVVKLGLQQAMRDHTSVRLSAEVAQTGLVFADQARVGRLVSNLASQALKGAVAGDTLRVLLTSRVRAASLVVEGPPDRVEHDDVRRLREGLQQPIDERPIQLGLELTMADALLRAMGGDLVIERGPRAQIRFLATLPLEPAFENSAG